MIYVKPMLVVVFEARDIGKTVRIKTRFTAYIAYPLKENYEKDHH